MNVLRFLHPECIKLDLDFIPAEPLPDETEAQAAKRHEREKEVVLSEFAELLDRSGLVANRSKFTRDLINRERKATTAIAPGIAIPHVRTMHLSLNWTNSKLIAGLAAAVFFLGTRHLLGTIVVGMAAFSLMRVYALS